MQHQVVVKCFDIQKILKIDGVVFTPDPNKLYVRVFFCAEVDRSFKRTQKLFVRQAGFDEVIAAVNFREIIGFHGEGRHQDAGNVLQVALQLHQTVHGVFFLQHHIQKENVRGIFADML